ncbi:MAG: ChaN family lipoprotein [Thermodesulfobacteriota bacterium]
MASRLARSLMLALLALPLPLPLPALAVDQPTAPTPQAATVPSPDLAPLLAKAAAPTSPAERKTLLLRHQSLRDNQSAAAMAEREGLKAAMLLHMLRRQLGDERFNGATKPLLAGNGPVAWEHLRQAVVAANPELNAFFSQWLDQRELPRFTIKTPTTREEGGRVHFSFTLAQEQTPPTNCSVAVRITTPAERVNREIVLSAAETPVSLTLSDLPGELLIDPEYHLLRPLAADEYPPVWARYRNSAKPLMVVPDEPAASAYAPLMERLRALGGETIPAATAKDSDVAGRDVLFLGLESPLLRALFARPTHPATGLTLEVRENPLGPGRVAVLLSAASAEETAQALPRLFGELDLATSAHLDKGAASEQRTRESDMGIGWWLDLPPFGVALADRLDLTAIMERLRGTRVIYLGETHDKFEDHRLQLRVIRAMHRQWGKLAIGMEMFPRSTQAVLDAFVAGTIDEREFLKKSGYFRNWGFDYRLYRDILIFARENKLPVVALNLDKGITSKVFRNGGLAALTPEEAATIPAERDLTLPGYRERITEVFAMHGQHTATPEQANNFLQAQALWDEAMAEAAAEFLRRNPDHRMAMVVGQGHAVRDTAIPPRLARRLPVTQAVILPAREHEVKPAEADYLVSLEPAPLPPLPLLGVQLADSDKGVRVMGLAPEGKAGEAGIEEGDYLLALDGETITAVEDVKIAMLARKKGESVQVRVLRPRPLLPDRIMTIAVPL